NDTTWPQPCTPASVRPAQVIVTGARSTRSIAAARVPLTVSTPGLGAKPAKPLPSYATRMRTRVTTGSGGLHQLDASHGRVVALARAELEDARVATRTLGVPRRDLGDQLVHHLLVADVGDELAVLVEAALLRLRDHLLGNGAERLGLRLGRDDRLGGDQRRDE